MVAKATDVTDDGTRGNDIVGARAASAGGFALNLRNGLMTGSYWITNDPPAAATGLAPFTFSPTLFGQRLDDTGLALFRNGIPDGSAAFSGRTNALVGVSVGYRSEWVSPYYGFIGEISEVLIYDRALSAEERMQVETHLTNKWFTVPAADGLPVTRDLKFRVDASDASSVVTTALGRVSRWSGKGPTEYSARQTLAERQPAYKPDGLRWRPSLSFNGTNVLSMPVNAINYSNHTVFVVAQAAETSGSRDFLGSGGTGPGYILLMNNINKYRGHYWASDDSAGSFWLDSVSPAVLTPVIYGQTLSDTGFRIYRNGALDNERTAGLLYTNVLRGVTLGYRYHAGVGNFGSAFKGELSEVLIYDRALTDEERQAVEAYLYEKWLKDRRGTLIRMW